MNNKVSSDNLIRAMADIGTPPGESIFTRAKGVRLWDTDGNDYVDAFSGMMNVNLGYGQEDLTRCLYRASQSLSFAISFFGYSHEPGAILARELANVMPGDLEHVFFTTGGSDAIDTAIKIARRYHRSRGNAAKIKIIARRQSYHGMSLAATALTGNPLYWADAEPRIPGVVHIDQPQSPGNDAADDLERQIEEEGPETVAAFVAEPVGLPTGAQRPPDEYWPRVRELCDAYDVLMVTDEVITGFGRTGRLFAIEHWDVVPDMLIMAKGLTAGYAPLGAVGLTGEIHHSLAAETEFLPHGFTCGGHPISCAVATEALRQYVNPDCLARADAVGSELETRLRDAQSDGQPVSIRRMGALLAVDTEGGAGRLDPLPSQDSFAGRLNAGLRSQRVLTRVYGTTVIMGPSFVATAEDCAEMASRFQRAVKTINETDRAAGGN